MFDMTHPSLLLYLVLNIKCMNEECCLACHVGCAKWSATNTRKKLLYFFPGNDTDDDHMEFYCKRHAKVKTKTNRKDGSNEEEDEFSDSEDRSDAIVENENDIFDADSDNETKSVKHHSTTTKRNVEKQSSTDSVVQNKTKKKSVSSQKERKLVKQTSQDTIGQRKDEGNSKYFEKKQRLKDSLEQMTKDLNSAIESAVEKGRDVEVAKKRVYLHWKQHGHLTKKEFADLWQKICDPTVGGGAKNLESHRNRNVAGNLKRQVSDEGTNGSNRGVKRRKKEIQNRWIKLFVPFYEEGAICIDDEKFCKQIDITESDFENDDEVMLSS